MGCSLAVFTSGWGFTAAVRAPGSRHQLTGPGWEGRPPDQRVGRSALSWPLSCLWSPQGWLSGPGPTTQTQEACVLCT